jgi:hypothetical protein
MTKFSSSKKTGKNSPNKTVGSLTLSGKKKVGPVKTPGGWVFPSSLGSAGLLAFDDKSYAGSSLYSKESEEDVRTQLLEMFQKDLSKESTVAHAGAEESDAARLKARHAMLLSLIGQDELRHRLEGLFPNILSKASWR